MSAIVNARDVLLQAAATRFVTPVLTGTIPLGQVTGAGDLAGQDTVGAGQLDAGIITVTAFASGIEPVTLVASVPGTQYTSTIFNTADGKLYRWDGAAYVATVPTTDLTGTVSDAQIAGMAASKVTGQLTNAQIADVAAAKLTGQITSTQITDGAISTPQLAAGAVSTAKLAAGAVTADEIASNAVTAAKILAGAVTTAKLAAGAVTANEIAAGAVTAGKVAALAITAAELAADAVTAGKVAAGAISTSQLAAGAVTTAKLAVGAVTANEISVTSLSAIAANLGTITAGTITFSGAGTINSGKTAYGSGTGFFLGHSGVTPVFDIGSTANYLRWTGSALDVLVNGAAKFTGAWTGTKGTTVLEASTSSGTNVSAIVGVSSGVGGAGVRGDGYTYGVRGEGGAYGTHGSSASTGAYGAGEVYGVHGYGTTIGSVGVRAEAPAGPALQVVGTMTMSSSTLVANLNAQYLNGNASTAFAAASHATGTNTDHDQRYPNNWPTDSGTALASFGMNINCTITGYRTRGSGNTIYIEPVSDERLKHEIEPETLGREFVRDLQMVRYRKVRGGLWHHGFLHRHMARLLPDGDDAIATVLADGAGSSDYQSLIGPLARAFQEQDAELQQLAAQVRQLASDLQSIRSH